MNRLLKKINFKPLSLTVIALFVFWIIVPEITNAGLFDVIPSVSDLVAGLFRAITYIFNFIGVTLFTLAGLLVNLMLGLNIGVLDQSNSLVHIGWRIVRDIANLGFVLVIIVIAIATMLRFKQYHISKLLPKLIAAAIIVNFSFAIGAVFISFSNVLTNFFAARALPEKTVGGLSGWDLSTSLADAFGPQRFFIETNPLPPNPDEESGGGFGTAVLLSIAGLVFTVIFTFLGALVLLGFAFLLLIRYLYLTFLMILAPLVWLFWVIPLLEEQFHKWWTKFLQWVFFAPASMFFVYLALVSIQELGKTQLNLIKGSNAFTGSLQNIMIQGAQMVVLGGILIGGLIIAQKMSINFASNAVNAAKEGTFGLSKWMGRKGLRGATLPLRAAGLPQRFQQTGARMRQTGAQRVQAGGFLGRIGGRIQRGFGQGLAWVGTGISRAGAGGGNLWDSTVKAAVAGWKKKKIKLTPEEIATGEV